MVNSQTRKASAGGSRPGAGRKSTGERATEQAVAIARAAGSTSVKIHKQTTMEVLLGKRQHQDTAAPTTAVQHQLPTAKRPVVFKADVLTWAYNQEGASVDQKQVKLGPVLYAMESEKSWIVVEKGSPEKEETFWLDEQHAEVAASDPRAKNRLTRGGGGMLKIRECGEQSAERWVTAGHVKALGFGACQPPNPTTTTRTMLGTETPAEKAEGNKDAKEDEEVAEGDSEGELEPEQRPRQIGAGRKEITKKKKRKQPRQGGAKGHTFQPKWLDKFDWLRTEPARTRDEWEALPAEVPKYQYCACCVWAAPRGGHKDVLTKFKPESLRGDKLRAHCVGKPAHTRAYRQWKANGLGAHTARTPTSIGGAYVATVCDSADEPLAALVRTVMTIALTKSPLSLAGALVQLQVVNGGKILQSHSSGSSNQGGVHGLLHAASTVLRREQDGRLRAAGIFSSMGDGSTDRKTVEQEIIYVRYPVFARDRTKSLEGLRMRSEFLDLMEVDVSYSSDKKSFDARAVLRSTYHAAFLERGLASLPAPKADLPDAPGSSPATSPTVHLQADTIAEGRARRCADAPAGAAPTPAALLEKAISLHNTNLLIGPGDHQIYPSRLVSTSLDGASVNMGEHAGVVALLKKEVPHVIGVHAVAHVLELGWADAVKDVALISQMLEINQEAYTHYAQSGKKRLSFLACCQALGEEGNMLISMHGIRWRESSYRGAVNLLKTWRARTTDLLEEASIEVGMALTPLSAPELFIKINFRKKTPDYNGRSTVYVLQVKKFLGLRGGVEMFEAQYQTSRKEVEEFSKGDILAYLLQNSDKKEVLLSTTAGKLYARMTKYSYVKTLHAWADLCSEGKLLSKTLQRSNVLISDVTEAVEDCISAVKKLSDPSSPGPWMNAFKNDYDSIEQSLDTIGLTDVDTGEVAYTEMMISVCESIHENINDRFVTLLKNPILKAACIFEHARWPSFQSQHARLEVHGETEVRMLLEHFEKLFKCLGGDGRQVLCSHIGSVFTYGERTGCLRLCRFYYKVHAIHWYTRVQVIREWTRLKMLVMRNDDLRSLKYAELYERLFDQFSDKLNPKHFYNVLLLAAIIHTIAVDTSICERGFSTMNNLKTARRSRMGKMLLRILMTICSLGAEWKDVTKIPVSTIIEEWRAQSLRGRYEGKMWSLLALEDPLLLGALDGDHQDSNPFAYPGRTQDAHDTDNAAADEDSAAARELFTA